MISLDTLRQQYALSASRFITLGDVPVHYVDQGAGPTVVLVHGSFLDLTSWQPWLDPFFDYRVVRYDRLRWGLTGQGLGPVMTYADEEALLAALVDQLGLDRFVLAGSSSGGMTAASYAANNPERVTRLILANFPLGHSRIRQTDEDEAAPQPETPQDMMRRLLERNLVDQSLVSEALVARLGDFCDRPDPTGSIASSYAQAALLSESHRIDLLRRLTMPTLVMWSEQNRTLPVEDGRAAFDHVGAADKQFVLVRDAGHMLPLEKGAVSGRAARDFVDGARLPPVVG